jgi:phosphotriesterase-related protein
MASIQTVTGRVSPGELGIVDAHAHAWIAPVPAASPGLPQLADLPAIQAELVDYRQAGGSALVDCQPGGCGRDGRVLAQLSAASGVYLIACTGFHLRKYYPPDAWLWQAGVDRAHTAFVSELSQGLVETPDTAQPVKAGFVKIACEATLEATPAALVEAAAGAALQTGSAVLVHTERGLDAERIVAALASYGLKAGRLILCHMDKRPDPGLHRALAQQGVLLEYDTFYRPRYQPEQNAWPLLERMLAEGLEGQLAIGTDMAYPSFWSRLGGGPGLTGLMTRIIPRLRALGCQPTTIKRLTGANIAGQLAQLDNHSIFLGGTQPCTE